MDWYSIWYWLADNWDDYLGFLVISVKGAPIWVIMTIAGCLVLEGIRHFVRVTRLRRHIQKFELAEIENRLGVIEKPSWERKRNKEITIDDRTYHPLQREPGGIWLQIAAEQADVQSRVTLVSDIQQLIKNSVDFHSVQHKGESIIEAVLATMFIVSGVFVSIAYYMMNLIY